MRFLRRLRYWLRRDAERQALAEEIEFHRALTQQDLEERGIPGEDARQISRRVMGNTLQSHEDARNVWIWRRLEDLGQDTRHAIRVLGRTPSFSMAAILTLVLGIGATTAVFSIVDATILRPLPYPDPDRLFRIEIANPLDPASVTPTIQEYDRWTEAASLAAVTVIIPEQTVITGGAEPLLLDGAYVPAGFFDVVRIEPQFGRRLLPEDDRPDSDPVVVLSHRAWQELFGEETDITGRTVEMYRTAYTVVGVMPEGFRFPVDGVEYWVPYGPHADELDVLAPNLRVYARVQARVTADAARAELDNDAAALAAAEPDRYGGQSVTLTSLHQEVTGVTGSLPLVLLGAVAIVLLIAITNVGNLMLGHASTRQAEITVRLAIGAGRGRVIRQLLTEGLVLSLIGGGAGLALASWLTGSIARLLPDIVPRVDQIGLHWRVAAFTAGVSVLSAVLFALYPSWIATGRNRTETTRPSLSARPGRLDGRRARGILTMAEVSMAIVLLIAAGLLLESYRTASEFDSGVDAANVMALHMPLPAGRTPLLVYRRDYFVSVIRQLIEEAEALPGIAAVAVASDVPMHPSVTPQSVLLRHPRLSDRTTVSIRRSVSPDYFRVIGTRLVSGRVFRDTDAIDSPPVVIVSEQTATEYWPDGEAVGRTLEWQSGRGQPITAEVIGVVDDLHSLSTTARPDGGRTVYTPLYADGSLPFQNRFLIVRGNSNPAPLAPALGNLIRSTYSSSQAVTGANRLEDFIARELGPARFGSFLLGSFAVIAFVIALIGIYGVASCAVARRTYEMGVRMALGARRRDIFTMVLTESMAVVLLGVLLGVGVAVGGNRIVESFLFQTESIDAGVFGLVVTVFIVVALAASSIPARRAARSDPATALRAE